MDERLSTVFDSFGLSELVCAPTRDNNLLDVLVSSHPSALCEVRVSDAGLVSDHRLVTARLVCSRTKVKTSYRSRNIRAIDVVQFDRALRASPLFADPAVTPDGFAHQLRDVVTTLLDKLRLFALEFDVDRSLRLGGCQERPLLPNVSGAGSNDAG